MESSGTSYALQTTLHQTRYTTYFIGTTNIGKAKIFFAHKQETSLRAV